MTADICGLTDEVAELIHNIKIGKTAGSYVIANATMTLFKNIICKSTWTTVEELINLIKSQGRFLVAAVAQEPVTANIARRFLKIIREIYDPRMGKFDDNQASLHKLVTQTSEHEKSRGFENLEEFKSLLLDNIQEIENELETSSENISSQAAELIHSSEMILTIGYSRSVENFLKSASKTRQFEVVVAECAPACRGHILAAKLAKYKIETTIIPDSAIFAMMSRVNKVIIGTHSVLANGGLRASCGTYSLALAAKHYSVPVNVLVPMYKLSPVHLCSYEQDAFNLVGCTEGVIPYDSSTARFTKAYSPIFDYVPPELVTLFITNMGGNASSYVYRLITELYHPDDYDL